MARQNVLPAIDLRSPQEKKGLSQSEAFVQSILPILQTIGQAQKVQQDRQDLETISRQMALGVPIEQAIQSVASQKPQFDEGFRGGLQRLGSAFAPQGARPTDRLQEGILGQQLKQALAPAPVTPAFEQTKPEKALDRDIKILANENATDAQKASARRRMELNPAKQTLSPGALDDQFETEIEGKPRVIVDRAGFNDKAFGEEAYNQLLKEVKTAAKADGFTEESVEAELNRWWDGKVAEEAGESFVKYVPRSEFKGRPQETQTQKDIKELEELRRKRDGIN